jgi:hypothetical protein
MSTEIATILSNAALSVQNGLDEDTAAIAGSVGNKRISIAGGTFRMMVNGKEQAAIEERHMNVVFVKMSHDPSRTWYAQATKKVRKFRQLAGHRIPRHLTPMLRTLLRLLAQDALTVSKVLDKVVWARLAVCLGELR